MRRPSCQGRLPICALQRISNQGRTADREKLRPTRSSELRDKLAGAHRRSTPPSPAPCRLRRGSCQDRDRPCAAKSQQTTDRGRLPEVCRRCFPPTAVTARLASGERVEDGNFDAKQGGGLKRTRHSTVSSCGFGIATVEDCNYDADRGGGLKRTRGSTVSTCALPFVETQL